VADCYALLFFACFARRLRLVAHRPHIAGTASHSARIRACDGIRQRDFSASVTASHGVGLANLQIRAADDYRLKALFHLGAKSTLLEGLTTAYGFNPEGGTLNYRFTTWYEETELGDAMRLSRHFHRPRQGYFFRAESFFNLASKAAEYDAERGRPSYGDRNLHEQSHGESFLNFFQTFCGPGLYIMDEPKAALSPQRQLTLLLHMSRMAAGDEQFIVASHSPILLGFPNAQILSFDGGRIHDISWEETDSYKITKLFLDNREGVLRRLLDD